MTSANQILQISERFGRQRQEFLVARLGHELRTPLAPIRTVAALLEPGRFDPATLVSLRAVLERQLVYIARVVDDLLVTLSSESDQLSLVYEVLDLNELTLEAISAMQPCFEARRQILTVSTTNEKLQMRADSIRLIQVLVNLLQNASRYTNPGGSINVSLRENGGYVEIEVRDTGIGISRAMLKTLFEPYARDPNAVARCKEGMGLGLSIVREIVQLHGGNIIASSEGDGLGSCFLVRLPMAPDEFSQVPKPQGTAAR